MPLPDDSILPVFLVLLVSAMAALKSEKSQLRGTWKQRLSRGLLIALLGFVIAVIIVALISQRAA